MMYSPDLRHEGDPFDGWPGDVRPEDEPPAAVLRDLLWQIYLTVASLLPTPLAMLSWIASALALLAILALTFRSC